MTVPTPAGKGTDGAKRGSKKESLGTARHRRNASRNAPRLSGHLALTEPEVHRLLQFVPTVRDAALLRLAISTGIRREDIVGIRLDGVDLHATKLSFWEGKKSRTWTVPLAGRTLETLTQHINTLPRTPWLFPSPLDPKRHMSGRFAYTIFNQRLEAVGLAKRPFHALRATCIKLAQKRGWTIEQVMALTGDSWRVIQEHYATPSQAEMQEVAHERPIE